LQHEIEIIEHRATIYAKGHSEVTKETKSVYLTSIKELKLPLKKLA
jgi:hypothetical protein